MVSPEPQVPNDVLPLDQDADDSTDARLLIEIWTGLCSAGMRS
jgi:hypothetical protein